jgi:peptidoglycan/xylan/chitin deacetylase (PgdA/CDA1 family)
VLCDPGVDEICGTVPAPTPLPSEKSLANMVLKFHVPILEYHRVKPYAGETGYAVSLIVPPETFAAQMKAMAGAGYHTITMGELGEDMRTGIQPAPKSFVVTFDDGYEDGYTYARPILQSEGFVATYFVIGSMIDHPDHLKVAELRSLVASGNEIGNHTMSHEDLRPYVLKPEKLKSEIYDASAIIAADVGVWPRSFCYPAGFTNTWVEAEVAATPGIETAVIQSGHQPETWGNRLEMPRIRVSPALRPADLVTKADLYLK